MPFLGKSWQAFDEEVGAIRAGGGHARPPANHQEEGGTLTAKAPVCETRNVKEVYDAIAQQWHHTRSKRGSLWPRACQFLDLLPPNSLVADVGCGDGKYRAAGWAAGHFMMGFDISMELLRCCLNGTGGGRDERQTAFDESGMSKRPEVTAADCLNVPFREKGADAAICIAVMHHLSSKERRVQCLRELKRIVRVGGKFVVLGLLGVPAAEEVLVYPPESVARRRSVYRLLYTFVASFLSLLIKKTELMNTHSFPV